MSSVSFTAELPETSGRLLISQEKPVTRDYFLGFIAANPDLRTELTAEGEMIVMAPAYSRSGQQNSRLTYQLVAWADLDGSGQVYDCSAGFNLPNGATRSPDASWVLNSRLEKLTEEERSGFLPLCPDFVVELRSKSDSSRVLQSKMTEYLANGARLGWLIDPFKRSVHVYRPQHSVQLVTNVKEILADPELPGLVLNLQPIFDPRF